MIEQDGRTERTWVKSRVLGNGLCLAWNPEPVKTALHPRVDTSQSSGRAVLCFLFLHGSRTDGSRTESYYHSAIPITTLLLACLVSAIASKGLMHLQLWRAWYSRAFGSGSRRWRDETTKTTTDTQDNWIWSCSKGSTAGLLSQNHNPASTTKL